MQDYLELIIKKHDKFTENPPVRIYLSKIEYIITFKIETVYYLELSTSETMKLLGKTKNKIITDENGKNITHSETTKVSILFKRLVYISSQQIFLSINR